MDRCFSKEEIARYLKKLKKRKATGLDGIPNELYKEGGEGVTEGLYVLFKKIWEEGRVPIKWNESKVTLLHKGGHKSKKELKNYRPIAVNDTVGKIFCGLLNDRMNECCERNEVMGEEQNGFRKGRRGEDNMYVVNTLVETMGRIGAKMYLAFLDIEKAYDRVNREILCKLLERVCMSKKVVDIITSLYEGTRAIYRLGEIETEWVSSRKGVRQGCVLSPLLFGLYTEELAIRIRNSGYGIRIGDERLGCLLYADDIVVVSEDKDELQKILDIVDQYGKEFEMKFSKEKSKVLVINADENDEGRTWDLGNMKIGRNNSYKYLGMIIDEQGTDRTKRDRIAKGIQWVGRLGSVSRYRANKYEVVRGLWKGMAVPGLMYGLETMSWTNREIDKMEVVQNRVGRVVLGANRYAAVETIRGEAGWSTFEERIGKAVLKYKVRLEKMPEKRLARRVYEWVGRDSKWTKASVRWEKKNGLEGFTNPEELQRKSEAVLQRRVNDNVKKTGLDKWHRGMREKSSLVWYREKEKPKNEVFYDGGVGSMLLFKARTKSLEVNNRTHRWANEGNRNCNKCGGEREETVEHIMLECPRYEGVRRVMIEGIKKEVGEERWITLLEGNREALMVWLLGLDGGHGKGKIEMVKDFLEQAWRIRGS